MSTFGPDYSEERDGKRLKGQMATIRDLMLDGKERTLQEIQSITGYPESSISAQLRHLKKLKFGSYEVSKRNEGGGTWWYRVREPKRVQATLFEVKNYG